MDRPGNPAQWNISRLWPLLAKSPVQSLDYRANSYHIHLSVLGFHGYGEEISQICLCPFCPINSSFSGTPSPSHHSTAQLCFSGGGTVRELQELQQEPPPTTPKFSIFSPTRRWPSTSSFLRSAYCSFSCTFIVSLFIRNLSYRILFPFCSSFHSQKFLGFGQ